MSKIDNNNTLLREQSGKTKMDIFTTETLTGKDYWCVSFPVESEIQSITMPGANSTLDLAGVTVPAGYTLMGRVTEIRLASGVGIGYIEIDGDINA